MSQDPDIAIASMRRVLVVDDHAPSAEMVAEILTLEGYEVRIAHSAGQAMDVALQFSPHVAILDIGLPDEDGFEVARNIKGHAELQAARLIALSGYGQSQSSATWSSRSTWTSCWRWCGSWRRRRTSLLSRGAAEG
jgi:PleD family two-component response regulator